MRCSTYVHSFPPPHIKEPFSQLLCPPSHFDVADSPRVMQQFCILLKRFNLHEETKHGTVAALLLDFRGGRTLCHQLQGRYFTTTLKIVPARKCSTSCLFKGWKPILIVQFINHLPRHQSRGYTAYNLTGVKVSDSIYSGIKGLKLFNLRTETQS